MLIINSVTLLKLHFLQLAQLNIPSFITPPPRPLVPQVAELIPLCMAQPGHPPPNNFFFFPPNFPTPYPGRPRRITFAASAAAWCSFQAF
jgi:hypothetical protein